MVPVPAAATLEEPDARLPGGCLRLMSSEAPRGGATVGELFGEDLAASLPPPAGRLDAAGRGRGRADKCVSSSFFERNEHRKLSSLRTMRAQAF